MITVPLLNAGIVDEKLADVVTLLAAMGVAPDLAIGVRQNTAFFQARILLPWF
jgi:hypothetical protein